MKKSFVFILAALLVVAFTLPASAFESKFGGYWRTRFFTQQNFVGDSDAGDEVSVDDEKADSDPELPAGTPVLSKEIESTDTYNKASLVDTRTRLYYDAIFSDNFSFRNRFEFNVTWGDDVGGDIGTDGTGIFRIKHSYADFRTGPLRHTIGLQGAVLARGFLFDDDFAGYIARYQPGTTADLLIPLAYIKNQEASAESNAKATSRTDDVAHWALYPFIPMGNMVLNPYFLYGHYNSQKDNKPWWLGLDFDFKSDKWSLWASGIYSGGSNDPTEDNKGYLLGVGADFNLGAAGLWVDAIYATGDDSGTDNKAFNLPPGASYYWSEVMGLGIFDLNAPVGAPGNKISNVTTIGVGVDLKTGDKLNWNFDLWWAQLSDTDAGDPDDIGTELDIILNWSVLENMTLDLVFGYLMAGDAVSLTGKNQDDPFELGARLSFSF